ncbi:MAG: hypothetical protein KDC71_01830 [Acidobacteria bacterium]|nr:hypothetical protein [Acidobacteriota bacterium]
MDDTCWENLAHWGAPLIARQEMEFDRNEGSIIEVIKAAHHSLTHHPEQPDFERKQDAFRALCLALKTHYPDHWQRTGLTLDPSDWPDRIIKLYRIAKARLGVVL